MKTKLLCLTSLLIIQCSLAQWSTSTNADSALYVCPGFVQTILTFDDGSSIICGALDDSRYAQKLDPYGFKVWPQPVVIMNTPGTGNDGISTPINDGNGGFFVWWPDNRGAEFGEFGPFNNAVYMQKVDKNGNVVWQNGGIQIAPIEGGSKAGYGVTDGQGGIIWYMSDNDFLRTNASMKAKTWLAGYDANGQKKWEHQIDSSTVRYQLYSSQPIKLKDIFQISTLNGFRFYNTKGNPAPVPQFLPGSMLLLKDTIAFRITLKSTGPDSTGNIIYTYGVTRISTSWDSVWYTEYNILDETNTYGLYTVGYPFVSDNGDGLYNVWRLKDKSGKVTTRAQWITKSGPMWKNGYFVISNKSASALFNGKNKLGLYFSDGTAQLFDSTGNALWETNNVIISDLGNAYSPIYASDNHGGCIIAYWTTLGGIYAQHTGRGGKVGIITKVNNEQHLPISFEVFQNYPNPFNPKTTISYELSAISHVKLKVYDVLGREVATLVDEMKVAGYYTASFDGLKLSSGVYFIRLTVKSQKYPNGEGKPIVLVRKMLLMK